MVSNHIYQCSSESCQVIHGLDISRVIYPKAKTNCSSFMTKKNRCLFMLICGSEDNLVRRATRIYFFISSYFIIFVCFSWVLFYKSGDNISVSVRLLTLIKLGQVIQKKINEVSLSL